MTKFQSKSDTLYDRVRSDILSLALGPDTPLRLSALSESYGIGVTPLRECLNRLASEQLVVPEHNKGFRVAPLTRAELLDLEQSRNAIEGAMFASAVASADDTWEAGVVGTFHQLSKTAIPSTSLNEDELQLWARRHNAFHMALVAGSPSHWMHRFSEQLGDQLGRYRVFIQSGLRELALIAPQTAKDAAEIFATAMALDPHRALYDAALARDPEAALAAFNAHTGLTIAAFEGLSALVPAESALATTLGPQSETPK
ncbi:MAG: GntR family transcriptional regulator [Aliishimia sp.]